MCRSLEFGLANGRKKDGSEGEVEYIQYQLGDEVVTAKFIGFEGDCVRVSTTGSFSGGVRLDF